MSEERAKQKLIERRERLMAGVKQIRNYTDAQIETYVNEAEHQDGYEYWLQFKTAKQLAQDMDLYFENMEKPE